MGPQLFNNLLRRLASLVTVIRRERDRSDAGMSPASIALTDRGKIDHILLRGASPRIGTDGNLRTKAALAQPDRVRALRVQVIRHELVVALKVVVSDIE